MTIDAGFSRKFSLQLRFSAAELFLPRSFQ